jgi:hypothetical protein
MASKAPLAIVKDRFGDKAKLVEAVKALTADETWLPRMSSDQGGNRGLDNVSNSKLLKLHDTLSAVKEKFGTRAKMVDAILTLENRTKDTGLKARIEAYPVPRLYDLYKSAEKRAKAAAKAAK